MKKILIISLLLISALASAQINEYSHKRIKIKHGDPAIIMMLLSGKQNKNMMSEISVILARSIR
jgi:hypothetical protein